MIWIDLEDKLPTDKDIPDWTPWSTEQWDAWLVKSKHLVDELAKLNSEGKRTERNKLIDASSEHWTKLKPWLLGLSHGKCWFSDVKELYSHYDVEHFRPKKETRVLNGSTQDGYWWLAFNYMNFRACGTVGNTKKGGWFPLRSGSMCSTYAAQCEECEVPYLLDPIDEEDVKLIAFDEKGDVVPTPGCTEWERTRVEETVKRLKLNEHDLLAEARRKRWKRVDRLIEKFIKQRARADVATNPVAKEKLREIRRELRELSDPREELFSVTRWCVIRHNDHNLTRLIA